MPAATVDPMTSTTSTRTPARKTTRKPATKTVQPVEDPLYEAVKADLGVDPVVVGSRPKWDYTEALRRLCLVA